MFCGAYEALLSWENLNVEGNFDTLSQVRVFDILAGMGSSPLGLWSYLSGLSGWAVPLVRVWSVLLDGEGGVLKVAD